MDNANVPQVTKWPFFLGDAILIGFAAYSVYSGAATMIWVLSAAASVIGGAWLAAYPYVLEYTALVRLAERDALQACTDKLKGFDQVIQRIDNATDQWQLMLREATNISELTKAVAGQMTSETKAFSDFLHQAHEVDKTQLRLQIDKLRRGEGEWLQVAIGTLDHIYALYQAGIHSGQPGLIEQLTMFQNACRDVARRVGLIPLLPNPGDAFDPKIHHLEDANVKPTPDSMIAQILAPGYTFQGQFLRPALVRVQKVVLPQTAKPSELAQPADTDEIHETTAPEPESASAAAPAPTPAPAAPAPSPSSPVPETPPAAPPAAPHRPISEQNLF